MEMGKRSDYDKYLILADNSYGKHKIKDTYESFLNYKIVIDVINRIAFTDKSTYSYNNNIYKKKITSGTARKLLDGFMSNRCYDIHELRKAANQLKIRL